MSSISRLYTFQPGTVAKAEEVNAELDQLVTAVNAADTGNSTNASDIDAVEADIVEVNSTLATHEAAIDTKLPTATAAPFFKAVSFVANTGKFVFTHFDDTTTEIDTDLEKVPVSYAYNEDTKTLVITLDDASTVEIPVADLFNDYSFVDSPTIDFTKTHTEATGQDTFSVTAGVKEGSITASHLEAGLQSTLQGYANTASAQATVATTKASDAAASAAAAALSASTAGTHAATAGEQVGIATEEASSAAGSAAAAAGFANVAATSAAEAAASDAAAALSASTAGTHAAEAGGQAGIATEEASAAAGSATNAAASETNASTYATNASTSATSASTSATSASASATTATTKAGIATTKATEAAESATEAAESAALALQYKNAADTSKTTASTKAGEASTSASEALASKTAAATSATNAATSEANALTYKNAAESAKTAAETAKTNAVAAKTAAETAKTAAQTAKTAAETAETNAEASATAAANSAAQAQEIAGGDYATNSSLNTHTSNATVHITAAERTGWNAKAANTDLTAHTGNTTVHVTAAERTAWNAKQAPATTLSGYGITNAYTKTETDTKLGTKVDKVTGKALSTNDYTTDDKTKVGNLPNNTNAELDEKGNTNTFFITDPTTLTIPVASWVANTISTEADELEAYPFMAFVPIPTNLTGNVAVSTTDGGEITPKFTQATDGIMAQPSYTAAGGVYILATEAYTEAITLAKVEIRRAL